MNKLEENSYRKCGVNRSPTKEDLKKRPDKPGGSLAPSIFDFNEQCFSLSKRVASVSSSLLLLSEILNTINEKLDKVETKTDCVNFVADLRKYLKGE